MKPDELDIIAHQALKAGLDSALTDLRIKVDAMKESVRRRDGPMLTTIAIHDFNAAMATVEARIAAYDTEYGHNTTVSFDLLKQRDDLLRKIESMRKTFQQIYGHDGEPDDASGHKKPKK